MSIFESSIALGMLCELIKKHIQINILHIDMDYTKLIILENDAVQNKYYESIFVHALYIVRNSDIFDNLYDTDYEKRMAFVIQNIVIKNFRLVIVQWILSIYGNNGEVDISYESFTRNNPGVENYYRSYYPGVNGRAIFDDVKF